MPAGGVPDAMGPDLSREGPFDASDVVPDEGQSPLILDGMGGLPIPHDVIRRTSTKQQHARHSHARPPCNRIHGGP